MSYSVIFSIIVVIYIACIFAYAAYRINKTDFSKNLK